MEASSPFRRKTWLALLLLVLASAAGGSARGDEPEAVKGTVARFEPEALYLKTGDAAGDDEPAQRSVMVLVDEKTAYQDGLRQATREDVVPGLIVLVKYEPAGAVRRALVIRIIGGKAP